MHPMLNIAIRAARSAGQVITRSLNHLQQLEITTKGEADFATNIDRDAESVIIRTIQKAYPKHNILGEESGTIKGEDSDFAWIIDPIDGTSNFMRGIPHYCVSIALKVNKKTQLAVVFDPLLNELFTATRGQGAQLNGYRIRTSPCKKLSSAIIYSNLPSRQKHYASWVFPMQATLFRQVQELRHHGSGALALAYVAAGRIDAALLISQQIWDTAAGDLLVREAGGLVTDINGNYQFERSGHVLATSPRLAKEILQCIQLCLPENLKQQSMT